MDNRVVKRYPGPSGNSARKNITTKTTFKLTKPKSYLYSHEDLSIIDINAQNLRFKKVPEVVRKKTRMLYIVRNEVGQLHSLWLHLLGKMIASNTSYFSFCGADEFAKMATSYSSITQMQYSIVVYAARTNVYRPKMFIKEVIPNWGNEVHILPYELFAEEPKTYLDKISNLMDIDSKITWNLYKNARADKTRQNLDYATMPNSIGNRNLSMRQRGLEFCRNFKHEHRLYDADWKLFFRTAEKYAATLPQQPRKAFTDTLIKIKNNWSGDSAPEIYKLATEPTFSNWLRGGEKAKPEFSKKTLERLRKIRAPQNRWLAKKFDLDLERYGYAM